MIPGTSISKTDGNLGVSSDTEQILVVAAPASAGPFNTPTPFTDKTDLITAHTSGALVEFIAYMLSLGIACVGIRVSPTTEGAYGSIDVTEKTGLSVVTPGATLPDYDYDVIVRILNGGTVGVAGITFQFSLDNGENWSQPQALGSLTTMTLARGVSFALTAATLVAGDQWTVSTTGPKANSSDIATSLTALTNYTGEWLRVLTHAEADATILAQYDLFAKSFHAGGKYPEMIGNTRPRAYATEDRPTYQTAMAAISSAVQSTEVSCAVDACEIVSELNGWRLRFPASVPYAARLMTIDDSQDAAEKATGALPGVFITDRLGDIKYHDEFRFPGLDDVGFTTLRTFGGRPIEPGVYINNPRLLSGPGSDFRYFQHSALLNRAIEKTYGLTNNRLSKGVLVDTTTGKIREDVAKGIESAISAELRTEFSDPGRCSGIQFALSRTDDILTTDTLHFSVAMVPLAYTKQFIGKAGLAKTLS